MKNILNKVFATLAGLAMVISAQAQQFNAENEDGKVITYYITDSENRLCCVSSYDGSSGNNPDNYTGVIAIPEKVIYDGMEYTVTRIEPNAFLYAANMTSVTIPHTVTEIGYQAFLGCTSLTSITIPSSVERIENSVFQECTSLSVAFIEEGLTNIPEHLFYKCNSLTKLTIPSTVTSIGEYAFWGCSSLTSVDLSNVTTIDGWAFCGCSSLTSVELAEGLTKISWSAFEECAFTSFTIPETVEYIDNYAFYHCHNLTEITIPNSVKTIEDETFNDCPNLTTVTLGEGITELGSMLNRCPNITTVNLPQSLEKIGANAFSGLSHLNNITIPDGVTEIGDNAFYDCTSLKSVNIPSNVTYIGSSAFRHCESLQNIVIPEGVKEINEFTFFDCHGLESITIPEGVTEIKSNAFGYCSSLTEFTIPSTVTTIGYYALENCSSLAKINAKPMTPPTAYYTFEGVPYDCSLNVRSSVIDAYQTASWWDRFSGNIASLPMCETPSISYDGRYVSLSTLTDGATIYYTVDGELPTEDSDIYSGPFDLLAGDDADYSRTVKVFVKKEGIDDSEVITRTFDYYFDGVTAWLGAKSDEGESKYVAATKWMSSTDKDAVNALKVYGILESTDFDLIRSLSNLETLDLSEATINNGILPDNALSGTNLVEVTLPINNMMAVGENAFKDCTSLKSVVLSEGLQYIYDGAFSGCTALETINIPASLTQVGKEVFMDCSSLVDIDYSCAVTSIAEKTFFGCSSMTTAKIPLKVTTIGNSAYEGCTAITEVIVLPATPPTYDETAVVFEDEVFANATLSVAKSMLETYQSDALWSRFANLGFSTSSHKPEIHYDGRYISFTSDQENVKVYYTLDGTDPTNSDSRRVFLKDYNPVDVGDLLVIRSSAKSGDLDYSEICIDSLLYYSNDNVLKLRETTGLVDKALEWCEDKSVITSLTVSGSINDTDIAVLKGLSELATLDLSSATIANNALPEAAFSGTNLVNVTLPESLIAIGKAAFKDCQRLEYINYNYGYCNNDWGAYSNLPSQITSVGSSAFEGCVALQRVYFPSGVTSISANMFKGCIALNRVELQNDVTVIGASAFEGCETLSGVNVPSNLQSIGASVFDGCSNLSSFNLPDAITEIPTRAFAGCSNLTFSTDDRYNQLTQSWGDYAKFPDKLATIGKEAFQGCSNLNNEIIMPAVLSSIGASAFEGCTSWTRVDIPNLITTIEAKTFYNCTGLATVKIPSGVTSIGSYAFAGCENITDLTVMPTTPPTCGESVFESSVFENATLTLIAQATEEYSKDGFWGSFSTTQNPEISNSPSIDYDGRYVTMSAYGSNPEIWYTLDGSDPTDINNEKRIKYSEKIDRGGLKPIKAASIEFGKDYSDVNEQSYSYYANDKAVWLDDMEKFGNAYSWTNDSIRGTIKSLTIYGKMHYYDFDNLRSYFSNSLETLDLSDAKMCMWGDGDSERYLGDRRLQNMTKLTTVKLPNEISRFDNNVFQGCESLTTINMPDSLTSIGSYCFDGCTSLKDITLPERITEISSYTFNNCSSLTKISIPSKVSRINQFAFAGCSSLKSIELPESLTYFGSDYSSYNSGVFQNCTSLESITIPAEVTRIGRDNFNGCSSLASVELPAHLEYIYSGVFTGCTNLKKIYSSNVTPPYCYDNSFDESLYDVVTLYVPRTAINTYQTTDRGQWRLFNNILAATESSVVPEMSYDGRYMTMTVAGDDKAEIYYTTDGSDPANAQRKYNGPVDVGGLCVVRAAARTNGQDFGKVVSDSLLYYARENSSGDYEVRLRETTGLAEKALSWLDDKTKIQSLTVYGSMNTSDFAIFGGMTNMSSLNLDNATIENGAIPDNAFAGLSIVNVELPNNIKSIGASAFKDCQYLTYIKRGDDYYDRRYNRYSFPESLTDIGASAFEGCKNLASLYYQPTMIATIGESAFKGCSTWTSLPLPATVKSIGASAFEGNVGVTSLVVPPSITNIAEKSFYNCTGLTTITIPSDVTNIGAYAFAGCENITTLNLMPSTPPVCGDSAFADTIFVNANLTVNAGSISAYYADTYWQQFVKSATTDPSSQPSFNYNGRYLSMSASGTNPVIWYTTDGSDPRDENNSARKKYDTSFDIKEFIPIEGNPTTFQATAQSAGKDYSNLREWTPRYYGNDSIVILREYDYMDNAYSWADENVKSKIKNLTVYGKLYYNDFNDIRSYFSNSLETLDLSNAQVGVWGDGYNYLPDYAFSGMTKLETVKLPNNLTRFDSRVFENCTSLKSVNIPGSTTSIGEYAFYECNSIDSISLPYGINNIMNNTFDGCRSLETVTIPSSVSDIKERAFGRCISLKNIYVMAPTPPVCASDVFDVTEANLYVSDSTIYKEADVWKNFANVGLLSVSDVVPDISYDGRYVTLTVKDNPDAEILYSTAVNGNPLTGTRYTEPFVAGGLVTVRAVARTGNLSFGKEVSDSLTYYTEYGYDQFVNSGTNGNTITLSEAGQLEKALQWCKDMSQIDNLRIIGNVTLNAKDIALIKSMSNLKRIDLDEVSVVNNVLADSLFYGSNILSISLPIGLASLGTSVFENCGDLSTVNNIQTTLTVVGKAAFANCTNLTSLSLPYTTEVISDRAFAGCSSLEYVRDNSKYEGYDYSVGRYNYSYYLPDSLTTIGESAFEGCSKLNSVIFPNTLTSIGSSAFKNCTNISRTTIPSSVTSLAANTFNGCSALTNVTILENVANIGKSAFAGSEKISSLTVTSDKLPVCADATVFADAVYESAKLVVSTVAQSTLSNTAVWKKFANSELASSSNRPSISYNGRYVTLSATGTNPTIYYTTDGSDPVTSKTRKSLLSGERFDAGDTITVRATAKSEGLDYSTIRESSYSYYANENKVVLKERGNFGNAFNWTNDSIRGTIKSLTIYGMMSYDDFDNLRSSFSNSLETLDMSNAIMCMWGNSEGERYLSERRLEQMHKLKTVKLPNNITSFGDAVFENCESLTTINIPTSLTTIGSYCFSGCTSLKEITLPNEINTINGYTFNNCSSLTKITIPSSVSYIYHHAFAGCSSLKTVTLPENLNYLGGNYEWDEGRVFENCTSLESISIPSGVSRIAPNTFDGCTNLVTVKISSRIDNIYNNAFNGCQKIKDLYVLNQTPPTCWESVFDEKIYNTATLYVSKSAVETYKKDDGNWRKFSNVSSLTPSTIKPEFSFDGRYMTLSVKNDPNAEIFYTTGENGNPQLAENMYSGPFEVYDLCVVRAAARSGFFDLGDTVADTLTYLGRETSRGHYEVKLQKEALLEKSLSWLEDKNKIEQLTISGPLAQTDFAIFKEMSQLSVLTMSDVRVTDNAIPDNAFKGLDISKVYLPNDIQTIGASAFQNCQYLQFVQHTDEATRWNGSYYENLPETNTLPNELTAIGASAFEGCEMFQDLTSTPINLSSIGSAAFKDCISLTKFNLPKTLSVIADNTFNGCVNLETVSIPARVDSIAANAFAGCEGIISVSSVRTTPAICADTTVFASNVYQTATLKVVESATNAYKDANVWSKFAAFDNVPTTPLPTVRAENYYSYENDYDGRNVSFSLNGYGEDPDYWYTIDGSDPTNAKNVSRIRFTKPFDIGEAVINAGLESDVTIRVAAQAQGMDISPIYNWSPKFYANDSIAILKENDKFDYAFRWARDNDSIRARVKNLRVIGNMQWSDFDNLRNYFTNTMDSLDLTEAVLMDNNNPYLRSSAFSGMKLKSVKLPKDLVRIEERAFEGCDSLMGLAIPETVTEIRQLAFSGCVNLENINLPQGLTQLGSNGWSDYRGGVFKNCAMLDSITIPEGVSGVYAGTFEGCTNLKYVSLPAKLQYFGDNGYNEEYGYVFKNCRNLKEINIPFAITQIPDQAFYGCDSLSIVRMSSNIANINDQAFKNCTALSELHVLAETPPTMPVDNIATEDAQVATTNVFESSVFKNAKLLVMRSAKDSYATADIWKDFENVDFANASEKPSMTYNGRYMTFTGAKPNYEFYYTLDGSQPTSASNLYTERVDVGALNTVRVIARDPYLDFSEEVKDSITYYSRNEWGDYVAEQYDGNERYVLWTNATGIVEKAFDWVEDKNYISRLVITGSGTINAADFKVLNGLQNLYALEISDINIENNEIPSNAFKNKGSLKYVKIPSSIEKIQKSAFAGCGDLRYVTFQNYGDWTYDGYGDWNGIYYFPESLTTIGESAFENCYNLNNEYFPDALTTIGESAFKNCGRISRVWLNATQITQIADSAFNGTGLSDLRIPNEITSIGAGAFRGTRISNFVIPESVTAIGAYAFDNCGDLYSIKLPSQLKKIANNTFSNCGNLSGINQVYGSYYNYEYGRNYSANYNILPDSITTIGASAFENCTNLSTITIPEGLTSLGASAFLNTNVRTIHIPDGVNVIGDNTFKNCQNLVYLHIPEGVTSIGVSAFENCREASNLVVPQNITKIPASAFAGCVSMTKLDISDKIQSIGDYAFKGCENVREIWARSFTPATCGTDVFAQIDSTATLYVSKSVESVYAKANGWKQFFNFDYIDPCSPAQIIYDGRYLTLVSDTKNPTIYYTVNGDTPTKNSKVYTEPIDVRNVGVRVKTLVTKANVENSTISTDSIHYYFDGETVTVDAIGYLNKAFDWCEPASVENLTIKTVNKGKVSSAELASLHKALLTNLSFLDMSESVMDGDSLSANAFESSKLVYVSLPKTLKTVGKDLFKSNTSLAAIYWNAETAMPDNAITGVTNPNLLFFAKDGSYVPKSIVKNIVVNGYSDNVVLSDVESGNNNFYCPEDFAASRISYTHKFTLETKSNQVAGWETLALPFDVQTITHEKNGTLMSFTGAAAEGITDYVEAKVRPFWLYELNDFGFTGAANIRANTPYIISMPNNNNYATTFCLNGNVSFLASNAYVPRTVQNYSSYSGNYFIPTTMSIAKNDSVYAINRVKVGKDAPGSVFIANQRDVRPFEAYAMMDAVPGVAYAPMITLSTLGGFDTTGIDDVLTTSGGRQFKIYVVDGVLYISSDVRQTVRIFNASGAMVREVDVHVGENPVQGLTSGMYVVGDNKIAL